MCACVRARQLVSNSRGQLALSLKRDVGEVSHVEEMRLSDMGQRVLPCLVAHLKDEHHVPTGLSDDEMNLLHMMIGCGAIRESAVNRTAGVLSV